MDETRRRHYLEAMGIRLWERRDPQRPVETESAQTSVVKQPPAAEVTPDALDEWPAGYPPEREEPPSYAEFPPDWVPVTLPEEIEESPVSNLDWDGLRERVKGCRACGLRQGCTQTVFGVGNSRADLLVIGEAPGADEDRQGEPFVGRAGLLLNEMLLAMGFKREQVFIANILKCRPPNNRDPKAEEALHCQPYLLRQIVLIQPQVILSVGRISAQNLLKTEIPVGKLRGRVHAYGEQRIPLVVTYHPAYLLRSPEQKGKSWDDLQLAMSVLRENLP
ncbi:MAG: uracil-DNA glycosylase [Gammaproteobacteria bacterium]|nr:uracil-DNA glycosylase [Gammaproteobacteria bacterium]